jgi:hypothetical protein
MPGAFIECVVERIDAGQACEGTCLQELDEARDVARVRHQELARSHPHHDEATGRQGEDVVERERRHHDVLGVAERRPHPDFALIDVGHDVAVRQRRAFGGPCRSPRILEERYVLRADLDRRQRAGAASGEHLLERCRGRQAERLHRLLHVARHEVDDLALEPDQVAGLHDHDRVEPHLRQRCFDGVREVLDDERGCARRNPGSGS